MGSENKAHKLPAKKIILARLLLITLIIVFTFSPSSTALTARESENKAMPAAPADAGLSLYSEGGSADVPPELSKSVITPEDFEFMGAFQLPEGMLDGGWLDYYGGLTHRYVDGKLKLYTLAGPYSNRLPGGYMLEVEIPDNISLTKPYPRQNAYVSFGDIFQDKITQTSGDYTPDNPGIGLSNTSIPNGIYWDERDQRMYWSKVTSYDASSRPDTGIGYAVLDDETHIGTGVGSWIIQYDLNPNGGRRWTYSMTGIPDWFADAYLGGRRLGVGFGGCASIVSNGVSLGPTLYAIKPPDPATEPHMSLLTTSSIGLISHVFGFERPAALNASLPNFRTEDRDAYSWDIYGEICPTGIWIDGVNKHGVIAFATMASGYANTTVVRIIADDAIEVGDPGDIRPGDQIFVNTDWVDEGRRGYQIEAAMVADLDGNIIRFANPLKGKPIIEGYTAEITYSDGGKATITYFNRVVCGTVYYGAVTKSSRYYNQWYIYDPADLATVAQGKLARDEVEPVFNGRVDFPNVNYPLNANQDPIGIYGATFDETTGLLYLLVRGQQDAWSVVYVYHLKDEPPAPKELDSELISLTVNGTPYTAGDQAVVVETDEVFTLSVTMKNTGAVTWGQFLDQGERGSSLLSRALDYNDTFGVFYISPGQGQHTQPGETFNFSASLRAPAESGSYTMTWQLADWIIPYQSITGMSYETRPFYGDTVTVNVTVIPREEPPPAPAPRVPGVLDIYDFVYEGSFTLPQVPGAIAGDEKAFYESGITLRTVDGEKRLILTTGTYGQTLYEAAIPELGKFMGDDDSAVPIAELRTVFGGLPKDDAAGNNGTMWYDEESRLLYWTNLSGYGWLTFPLLRSARLEDGVLTEVQQWSLPLGATTHDKSYWGGVTVIPDEFARQYTGGRKLALGFGGAYSLIQSASMGPSLAAVSPDVNTAAMDFRNIMFYPFPETCVRDGNYFTSNGASGNPLTPWQGTWTNYDTVKSGVFIDLPGKQGYIAFARQAIGRIGYDYGGGNWNGKYQNVWYFYDFDALGMAASGLIPSNGLSPSSTAVIEMPYEPTKGDQYIAGSCFDRETRLLYLYTMRALKGRYSYAMYNDPVVHVYRVKEDAPTVRGKILSYNPKNPTIIQLKQGDNVVYTTTIPAKDGIGREEQSFVFEAVDPGVYTLEITKTAHVAFTVNNIIVGATGIDLTEDSREAVRCMTLLCGDINGDGLIEVKDLNTVWSSLNYGRRVSDAEEPICDLNGDGLIEVKDLNIVWSAENYGRRGTVIDY